MKKYFGTDGIRGKAYSFLTEEFAYKTGVAIAKTFKMKQVIIGKDTRESGKMIVYHLSNGLMSEGVDVYYQPNSTTPMISLYAMKHRMIGIMITASHNPYTDNGIKILDKGYKTTDDVELLIEKYMDEPLVERPITGHFYKTNEAYAMYVEMFDSLDLNIQGFSVAFDCAHGASSYVAPILFNKYVSKSKAFNIEPNGVNINDGVGSTHPQFLKEHMPAYDIGFSFDGDCDRCLIVDKNGQLIDGDMMMYIYGMYMKEKNLLKDNHVVLTKMSNPAILKALKEEAINYTLTDVGDKHVLSEMDDKGYTLGGEASGHIILRHLMHSGDGILMALYMLKILSETKKELSDYISHIQYYPFKMINIKNINKEVLHDEEVIQLIKEIENVFGEDSLILIRPSGTEPLIRVTMSHKDDTLLNANIHKMVELIKKKGATL